MGGSCSNCLAFVPLNETLHVYRASHAYMLGCLTLFYRQGCRKKKDIPILYCDETFDLSI